MKFAVIIPAYNEEKTIREVVKSIPESIGGTKPVIIVVNDGSRDFTAQYAKRAGAIVINHRINMGVGAATATGFEATKRLEVDAMVTLDADLQHDPRDINKLIKPIIKRQANVVVGTRLNLPKGMPWHRKMGIKLFNLITYIFYHIKTTDSQSGFRAYDKKAIRLINIHTLGYEFCTEIFGEIRRHKLKFVEVPIKTIYTKESRRKGQPAINGINIMIKLLSRALIGSS